MRLKATALRPLRQFDGMDDSVIRCYTVTIPSLSKRLQLLVTETLLFERHRDG